MKTKLIILTIITGILSSCDDRLESLEKLNDTPKIEFYNSKNEVVENLTDSVRLMDGGITVYNIRLKLADVNKNIQFLNWKTTKGDYKVFYQNTEVKSPSSFRTDVEKLTLNLFPTSLGTYSAEFKATDRFGLSSVSKFNLFIFKNLLPVAKLKATAVGEYEFILDASESYDQDRNFDGKVSEYIFKIDGQIISTSESKLKRIFQQGDHNIELTVRDNSSALSDPVSLKLTIK